MSDLSSKEIECVQEELNRPALHFLCQLTITHHRDKTQSAD